MLAALPIAVALLAAAHLLFGAADGLVISAVGTRREPAVVELLQGPLLVLALGALGVLLGRIAPVTPLALLLVVAIVFVEVPLAAWAPDTAVALGRAAREQRHRRARRLDPVRAAR